MIGATKTEQHDRALVALSFSRHPRSSDRLLQTEEQRSQAPPYPTTQIDFGIMGNGPKDTGKGSS